MFSSIVCETSRLITGPELDVSGAQGGPTLGNKVLTSNFSMDACCVILQVMEPRYKSAYILSIFEGLVYFACRA